MTDQDVELLDLVRTLADRVEHLETELKSLKLLHANDVPEDVRVAIAAAVAAYLGHRARRRQARFGANLAWQSATRRSQLNHAPLHLR